jgi:RNA polymerase sigma factor (sigma-70 family)
MSDYRLNIKVQNARILRRMEAAGIWSASELARQVGACPTIIGELLNLKKPAFTKRGEWRPTVHKISAVLNCMPEDLFSDAQRETQLKTNRAYIETSEAEISFVLAQRSQDSLPPDKIFEQEQVREQLRDALNTLRPREKLVVSARFGLDGPAQTLWDLADEMNISSERVRQIEMKAIRKLGRPSRRIMQ